MNEELKIIIKAIADQAEKTLADVKEEIQKVEKASKKASQAYGELSGSISSQSKELKQLREQYADAVAKYGETSLEARMLGQEIAIVSQELEKNKIKYKAAMDAADKYDATIIGLDAELEDVEEGNEEVADSLDKVEKSASDATKDVSKIQKSLQAMGQAAQKAGKVVGSAMKAIGSAIAKATKAIAKAGVAGIGALVGLSAATQDFREGQAKLVSSFVSVGSSAEVARDTYKDLYKFLGDDSKAVETAQSLALITQEEEKLAEWTNILMGAYALMGEKLPTEGLAEAANETINTGKATGVFADALNWAKVSEEEFNKQLAETVSLSEREQLVRQTLTNIYGDAAAAYEKLNGDMMAQREAQYDLNLTMGALGAIITPLTTSLINLANVVLTALAPAINTVLPYIISFVDGIAKAVQWVASFLGISSTATGAVSKLGAALDNIKGNKNDKGVADDFEKANDEAEKLKRTTAGFDELNIMSSASTGSSSGDNKSGLDTGDLSGLDGMEFEGLTALSSAFEEIGKVDFSGMGKKIYDLIDTILPKAISMLGAFIPVALTTVQSLLLSVIQLLVNHLPQLTGVLISNIPLLLEVLFTVATAIIEGVATILPQIIAQIVEVIPLIVETLTTNIPILLDAAVQLLLAIVQAIPKILPPLLKALPDIIDMILDVLEKNIPILLEAGIELLLALVDAIAEFLPDLILELPKIIKTICNVLIENLPVLLDGAIELFNAIIDAIPEILPALADAIPDIIDTLTDTLIDAIPVLLVAAVKLFFAIVDAIPKILPSLLKAIGELLLKLLANVSTFGFKLGDAMGDAIGGAIKEAINWVVSKVVKTINKFIDGINGVLGVINAIPGVDISKLKKLDVPKFAKGGIVNSATLGVFGEAGKEAVIPLENNTEWMDKLADRIASRNNTPTKLVLMLNERELGWANINSINSITKQTGALQLALY